MAWFRRRRTGDDRPAAPPVTRDEAVAEWAEQAVFVLMAHCEHLHDQVGRLAVRVEALEAASTAVSPDDLVAVRRETVHLVAELAGSTASLRRDLASMQSLTRQVALAQVAGAEAAAAQPASSTRPGVVLDLTDASTVPHGAEAGANGHGPTPRGADAAAKTRAPGNGHAARNGALHPDISRAESA